MSKKVGIKNKISYLTVIIHALCCLNLSLSQKLSNVKEVTVTHFYSYIQIIVTFFFLNPWLDIQIHIIHDLV